MSNLLAVATVTEALRQMLDAAVNKDISGGARATAVRPSGADKSSLDGLPEVGVNAYLYRISFNASWRNADLPTRRADATLSQRPRAAIDLNYLLTFYGDEKRLEHHRVAASVIGALHARPVLTRGMIRNAVMSADFLQGSDLADEVELVKFTPVNLSIEELQNLWSGFFQAPCALSVAYQASVIFIDGGGVPQEALPVRDSGIRSIPFLQPIIERVEASDKKPILIDALLTIQGRNLMGELTRIRIGDVEAEPESISDSSITIRLSSPPFPPGSLRAGIQRVQVIQDSVTGSPPTPHRSGESNAIPFILRPVVESIEALNFRGRGGLLSGDVTINLRPNIGIFQRAVIILNEISGVGETPAAYIFIVPPSEKDTDTIKMVLEGIKSGEYLVRVQVDGIESLLYTCDDVKSSDYGKYIGPRAKIEGK